MLAIGHSARDTYGMLLRRGVPIAPKPFQLGVRIEQPQASIDQARYGHNAGHPALGAADYKPRSAPAAATSSRSACAPAAT